MPAGEPRTEEERIERHEEIYGAGKIPPAERRGWGAYKPGLTWLLLAFLFGLVVGYFLA